MGGKRIHCDVPLNRVEGDLEVRVAVENDRVAEAWSRGTLFRGFERMLVDRAPMDSLVVTPRICGICSTTHLAAAARALDQVAGVTPPDNAIRMRNAALMAEQIQSDLRQSLLMFMVDFANSAYADHSLADEARRRYAPVGGQHHPPGARSVAAVRETKHILELVALVGGQWPHTSFMVPGGVVYKAEPRSLQQGRHIVKALRRWYEDQVLGCSLERWAAVRSVADLDAWLAESAAHRESDAGFLMRFGREAGLDRLGAGPGTFLSYGNLPLPAETAVAGRAGRFVPAGFARGADTGPFHEGHIAEHTAFSWYQGDPGGHHPWSGRTEPLMEDGGERYSWAKAPRYRGAPAETGPLAERILAGDGLFTDWVGRDGPNVLARQLARLTRPATLFDALDTWLREALEANDQPFYTPVDELENGSGTGLLQAARGALGHWVRVADGRIAHYQIVTPTAWNGSPRDTDGRPGPWEAALVGTPVPDPENPVAMGHVVRSFDPCLVCTVHQVGGPALRLGV